MARYFFHLRYGWPVSKLAVDPEGDEVADASLLRDYALDIARKVSRTRSRAVRDWMGCAHEVTDEQGRRVLTVPFKDSVANSIKA